MTENNVLNAQLCQHISGYLTCESAALLEVNVLSAYLYVRACSNIYSSFQVGERYASDDLNVALCICYEGLDSLQQFLSLGTGLVHLPVTCDDSFSYGFLHCKKLLYI